MKKKSIFKCIALMAMMLALPLMGHAQKFALIDMEYILKNIPAYERANEQLNQATKKWPKWRLSTRKPLPCTRTTKTNSYSSQRSKRKQSKRR